MKCAVCKKDIEEDSLGKLQGTLLKIKKNNKNELAAVCCECQKKENLKELKTKL
jgi:hypothetical protein